MTVTGSINSSSKPMGTIVGLSEGISGSELLSRPSTVELNPLEAVVANVVTRGSGGPSTTVGGSRSALGSRDGDSSSRRLNGGDVLGSEQWDLLKHKAPLLAEETEQPERVINLPYVVFMPAVGSSNQPPTVRDDFVEHMGRQTWRGCRRLLLI